MKSGEPNFIVVPIPGGGPLLVLKPSEFALALRRGREWLQRTQGSRGDSESEGEARP